MNADTVVIYDKNALDTPIYPNTTNVQCLDSHALILASTDNINFLSVAFDGTILIDWAMCKVVADMPYVANNPADTCSYS